MTSIAPSMRDGEKSIKTTSMIHNRSNPLLIIILLACIGYIGFIGLPTTRSIAIAGSGSTCIVPYTHHILKPFLKEWIQCSFVTPCGVNNDLEEHNAGAGALQCLCQRKAANAAAITDYYNQRFAPSLPTQSIDEICTAGAREWKLK